MSEPMCLWLRPEMGKEHPFWRNISIPWTCKVPVPTAQCQIAGLKLISMSQLDIANGAYTSDTLIGSSVDFAQHFSYYCGDRRGCIQRGL